MTGLVEDMRRRRRRRLCCKSKNKMVNADESIWTLKRERLQQDIYTCASPIERRPCPRETRVRPVLYGGKKNEKESLSLPILREYNIRTKGEVIHAVINQNATGYGRRRVCRLCCVFLRRIFSSRKDAT